MVRHVACIGVGNVGATCAYTILANHQAQHITLIDIDEDKCRGHAQDLIDATPLNHTRTISCGTYEDARNADVIIITAGAPQDPGQDRCDIAETNAHVVRDICDKLSPIADHTIILMITNPVDVMTYIAQKALPEARYRIVGTGTWLDTQRLRMWIGYETGMSPQSINAYVIGEHGDDQVIVWSHATHDAGLHPMPDAAKQDRVAKQVQQRAYRIIQQKGATYYGVSQCVSDIVTAIAYNERRIIPVSTYIARYETCLSMPAIIGENGIEEILSITLAPDEQETLVRGAEKLKRTYQACTP